MLKRHFFLYTLSRIFVAVMNFITVIVFVRLTSASTYGEYIIITTTSMVINGFSMQWARYTFFAQYKPEIYSEIISIFLLLGFCFLILSSIFVFIFFYLNGTEAHFFFSVVMLGISTSIFDATAEVSRTRLDAERAVISIVARSCLILVLGLCALQFSGTAWALALGTALANFIATIPGVIGFWKLFSFKIDRAIAKKFLRFGVPLMLSFGLGNLGQGMDRFLLKYFNSASSVGVYSPIVDIIRSSFLVFGESIAVSLISIAKQKHVAGDERDVTRILGIAYRLTLILCIFGGSFCIVFGDDLLHLIFPALGKNNIDSILPIIIIGASIIVIRNSYFAQVVYFSGKSNLELFSSILLLLINFIFGFFLVKNYDMYGAAWTFLIAQIFTMALYILYGRRFFVMPTPIAPLLGLMSLGLFIVLSSSYVDSLKLSYLTSESIKIFIFILSAIIIFVAFRKTILEGRENIQPAPSVTPVDPETDHNGFSSHS